VGALPIAAVVPPARCCYGVINDLSSGEWAESTAEVARAHRGVLMSVRGRPRSAVREVELVAVGVGQHDAAVLGAAEPDRAQRQQPVDLGWELDIRQGASNVRACGREPMARTPPMRR
jgi:hypothetical protein